MTDRGTLGGLTSQGAGGDPQGRIAVLSETMKVDPLAESLYGFGTDLVCGAGIL